MVIRWSVATVAAMALAWTTLTAEMPWLAQNFGAEVAPKAGESCPADAKPANLNFTLKDVNGKNVNLSHSKGKVILLDFWATWCGPCKVEIPWFVEFQDKYGKAGLQVIGISVDDTVPKLVPYVKDMKMNYPVLLGLGNDRVLDAYGPIVGLPVTMIISREGKICSRHIGMGSKEVFENQIKALL
jgi:thiol-disulfide isomerase/thioredoxin